METTAQRGRRLKADRERIDILRKASIDVIQEFRLELLSNSELDELNNVLSRARFRLLDKGYSVDSIKRKDSNGN